MGTVHILHDDQQALRANESIAKSERIFQLQLFSKYSAPREASPGLLLRHKLAYSTHSNNHRRISL